MNEPQWCDVKQAFCYCQERCIEEDEYEEDESPLPQQQRIQEDK